MPLYQTLTVSRVVNEQSAEKSSHVSISSKQTGYLLEVSAYWIMGGAVEQLPERILGT
jgi:hypothetical protein